MRAKGHKFFGRKVKRILCVLVRLLCFLYCFHNSFYIRTYAHEGVCICEVIGKTWCWFGMQRYQGYQWLEICCNWRRRNLIWPLLGGPRLMVLSILSELAPTQLLSLTTPTLPRRYPCLFLLLIDVVVYLPRYMDSFYAQIWTHASNNWFPICGRISVLSYYMLVFSIFYTTMELKIVLQSAKNW